MSGSRNETLYGDNVDFSGAAIPAPTVTTDGQLLIGSTAAPNIRVGTLTSSGGSITITPGAGTINLETAAAAGINTINGDSGSITGSTVTIYAHNSVQNCGATVLFSNTGTISTLKVTDAGNNTIIGFQAGLGATISGNSNVGLGTGVLSGPLTSGGFNTCIGNSAGNSISTQSNNTFIGTAAGFGVQADSNTALGYFALGYTGGHPTGTFNLCLGYNAGFPYHTTEASNILVGALGVTGDNNTTRIGYVNSATSTQTACYIDGIHGATPTSANTPQVVLCDNAGNLAPISSSTSGFVLTSNGSATPSFQAIPATTFPWTDEATSFSPASKNGYFVTGTATATLPASPSQGDTISFAVDTTNVLTITANTGQVIRIGSAVSAAAGTAKSNARGDSVTLVYRSSDTSWIATSVIGTWTVT